MNINKKIKIKNTPEIKKYSLYKNEKDRKISLIKKIANKKSDNRYIAKRLYKDIPKYSIYYKIIKHNEKINKRLHKKEPLKFVKINDKTNTLYKDENEKIKYKILDFSDKKILKIVHTQNNDKIKYEEIFQKKNNKYKIKYDIKIFLLNYLRSVIEDN